MRQGMALILDSVHMAAQTLCSSSSRVSDSLLPASTQVVHIIQKHKIIDLREKEYTLNVLA